MFLPVGGKTRADFLEGVITLAISTEETKEYSAKSDVGLAQVITMPGGEGWGGPPLRRTPCTGRFVKIVGVVFVGVVFVGVVFVGVVFVGVVFVGVVFVGIVFVGIVFVGVVQINNLWVYKQHTYLYVSDLCNKTGG